jgi:hypothetical protein
MIDREKITNVFPSRPVTRPSFHDLVKVILEREQAERFLNVSRWTDVIDFRLEEIGGHGIGPLLSIMRFFQRGLLSGWEMPSPATELSRPWQQILTQRNPALMSNDSVLKRSTILMIYPKDRSFPKQCSK